MACVALIIIAMPAIPHHHHSNMYNICLNSGDVAMQLDELCCCPDHDCGHEHTTPSDKKTCDNTCPSTIHAVKFNTDDHADFGQVTLQLFNVEISQFVILYLAGNKEFTKEYNINVEKYYSTPPNDIKSRRAPPVINA